MDRDAEGFRDDSGTGATESTWDVYHVENFLLDPSAIRAAAATITSSETFKDDEEVMQTLKESAAAIVDRLILEEVQAQINESLVNSIAIGASPTTTDVAKDLLPSIQGSLDRVAERGSEISEEFIRGRVDTLRIELENDLESEEWLKRFPGRLILSHFAGHSLNVPYETFRNVVMDKLAASEVRPENMRSVLDEIPAA